MVPKARQEDMMGECMMACHMEIACRDSSLEKFDCDRNERGEKREHHEKSTADFFEIAFTVVKYTQHIICHFNVYN